MAVADCACREGQKKGSPAVEAVLTVFLDACGARGGVWLCACDTCFDTQCLGWCPIPAQQRKRSERTLFCSRHGMGDCGTSQTMGSGETGVHSLEGNIPSKPGVTDPRAALRTKPLPCCKFGVFVPSSGRLNLQVDGGLSCVPAVGCWRGKTRFWRPDQHSGDVCTGRFSR